MIKVLFPILLAGSFYRVEKAIVIGEYVGSVAQGPNDIKITYPRKQIVDNLSIPRLKVASGVIEVRTKAEMKPARIKRLRRHFLIPRKLKFRRLQELYTADPSAELLLVKNEKAAEVQDVIDQINNE